MVFEENVEVGLVDSRDPGIIVVISVLVDETVVVETNAEEEVHISVLSLAFS